MPLRAVHDTLFVSQRTAISYFKTERFYAILIAVKCCMQEYRGCRIVFSYGGPLVYK